MRRFGGGLVLGLLAWVALVVPRVSQASSASETPPFRDEPAKLQTWDDLSLTAKWTLPSQNPQGVVVILPGSGTMGTDGDVSSLFVGHGYQGAKAALSDQIAERLAQIGIASFRYAKRGFEDPAQVPTQTLGNLTKDAESALAVAQHRFPALKSGLVGFSEGAILALLVAENHPVDSLYLLSLPTRPIDEFLTYQFFDWPLEVIQRLDEKRTGALSSSELAKLGDEKFPFLGPDFSGVHWQDLDTLHHGSLSIVDQVMPAYRNLMATIQAVLKSPAYAGWYESFKALPPFSEIAAKVKTPVYLYQGLEDAQIRWSWVEADQKYFGGKKQLRLFPGVGHCFAPMEGMIGQIKTSGPLSGDVLTALASDFQAGL